MAFKNIHTIDVAYDNKVYGNLIDPYEWNKNFTDIEQNITTNAENLNDNFAMLSGSDGAANITSPDVIGGTDEPSTVSAQLISIVNRLLETYTITELDSKFEQVNANTVRTISFNADNGSFIITNNDGSTTVIDTNIEKIPVSVSLEKNGEEVMLVITNYDGTTSSADVTNLLNVYNFIDSNTLRFNVDKYDISAEVKKGSITFEHLADGVVSAIEKLRDEARAAKNDAEAAKTAAETAEANAEQSAKISESYAVGTSGIRNGETTDNAKYYSEQAGVAKNEAEAARDEAVKTKEAVSALPRTYYGVCETDASEINKIVTVDDSFELVAGVSVNVQFYNTNTCTTPRLNVNNTGDKIIIRNTLVSMEKDYWGSGGCIIQFVYDGQYWVINNAHVELSDSVTFNNSTSGASSAAVKQAYDKAIEAKTVADAAATPEYVDTTVEQFVQSALQTVENNYLPLTGGVIEAAPGSTPEGNTSLTIKHGNTSIYLNADISVYDYDMDGNPLYASNSMITVSNQEGNTVNSAMMGTYLSIPIIASGGSNGGMISVFNGTDVSDALGDNALIMCSADGVRSLNNLTAPLEESDATNKKYVDDADAVVKEVADSAKAIAEVALPKIGGTMTGSLVLNAAPTADLEAANKKYVDDTVLGAKPLAKELHFYGDCLSAANEANKVVTVSDDNFKLMSGVAVDVSFLNANTASHPTLNVNNTGAVEIKAYSTAVPLANQWRQGAVVRFVYNTSNWVMVDGSVASTTYYGATKLNSSTSSTSEDTAATPLAVKQAYDKAVESDNKIDALETKINNIPKSYYGLCNTAAAEKEKIVTVDDSFKLEVGATVNVTFNYNNTNSVPVLNVNNTGAKPMVKGVLLTVGKNYWIAGGIVQFVYDGSYWVVSNALAGLSDSVENNSVTDAATSSAVKQAYDRGSTALTVASAAVPKSSLLRFTNVTFVANTGVTDTTYDGYAIRYDVSCTDVTTDYSADVRFAPADAVSGNFAPFCDTGDGVVKIYAKQAVKDNGGNITIPVIICTKMVD